MIILLKLKWLLTLLKGQVKLANLEHVVIFPVNVVYQKVIEIGSVLTELLKTKEGGVF